ncbi:MAG: ATP-binding protein [Gemmatimonadaceae bacterium]|nr:ATP-binding protein [Gemmatimonadaceae bacterium]MCW5826263.1 ATP-binding protein [Gemmatimonadaceae bacterium]
MPRICRRWRAPTRPSPTSRRRAASRYTCGAAFDPLARAAPDTTLSVEDRPIGGLGIHSIVRRLVDDVRYRRDGDHNVVVLTKRLDDAVQEHPQGGRRMEITTRTQGTSASSPLRGISTATPRPRRSRRWQGSSGGVAPRRGPGV